ncbi:unnamed protein product [Allacma fusca]|uniref:Uncharacterized protein n=1 Tax=Allacma fusca TaxID=39272 RepID=A0A8J2P3L0_9HEXA|nr:unnamed protein product [Allacma fusca]
MFFFAWTILLLIWSGCSCFCLSCSVELGTSKSEKEIWKKTRIYPTRDLSDIKLPDSDDDQKIVDLEEFRILD